MAGFITDKILRSVLTKREGVCNVYASVFNFGVGAMQVIQNHQKDYNNFYVLQYTNR